jgi:hypothetical protein
MQRTDTPARNRTEQTDQQPCSASELTCGARQRTDIQPHPFGIKDMYNDDESAVCKRWL